jgi:hypothetical protein
VKRCFDMEFSYYEIRVLNIPPGSRRYINKS